VVFFCFCLIILAFGLCRSWRRTFCPVFLSAVRAVASRCKFPLALRPGLSQERVDVPREIDIGKTKGNPPPVPYSSSADAMKSTSTSRSSSRPGAPGAPHSDTSLPASPSSSSGGTSLPTSVDERKSSTACPHRSLASRSRAVHLLFHLLVSFALPPTESSVTSSIPGTP